LIIAAYVIPLLINHALYGLDGAPEDG